MIATFKWWTRRRGSVPIHIQIFFAYNEVVVQDN